MHTVYKTCLQPLSIKHMYFETGYNKLHSGTKTCVQSGTFWLAKHGNERGSDKTDVYPWSNTILL